MKAFSIVIAIAAAVWCVFIMWKGYQSQNPDNVAIGTFVVLSFTFIALVWYAYETHVMTAISVERWNAEAAVYSVMYGMPFASEAKGDAGRTLFQLHNHSKLVVVAKVNCNFRVYGQPVEWGSMYNGQEEWIIFPQQMSQGWFEIEGLLKKRDKTVAAVNAESTPQNRGEQLTMILELEFQDELGRRRSLPRREWYFDFDRWTWIPHLSARRAARIEREA